MAWRAPKTFTTGADDQDWPPPELVGAVTALRSLHPGLRIPATPAEANNLVRGVAAAVNQSPELFGVYTDREVFDLLVSRRERDRPFMRAAIAVARKCTGEDDRVHPLVGAVAVRADKILGRAHRNEGRTGHAEYILLEHKLRDVPLAGATVYTTLEPCTTRNTPKVPCARRLIERKVERVVIGMLDPDERIRGEGCWQLREAGIEIALFPPDLMGMLEQMNRAFVSSRRPAR